MRINTFQFENFDVHFSDLQFEQRNIAYKSDSDIPTDSDIDLQMRCLYASKIFHIHSIPHTTIMTFAFKITQSVMIKLKNTHIHEQ